MTFYHPYAEQHSERNLEPAETKQLATKETDTEITDREE